MKRLLIVGNDSYARECLDIAVSMNIYEEIAMINEYAGIEINHTKVIDTIEHLDSHLDYQNIFIAVRNREERYRLSSRARELGYTLAVLVSPYASVSPNAVVLDGTVIFPFAYVGANAFIKEGCIIYRWMTVEPDTAVEEYTFIK